MEKERIITTITIPLQLLNYYKKKQTTRVKAPITTKNNNKKPVALRSVNRSKRRRHVVLPSNTVLRLFCLVSNIILQPEIVANDRTTYVELCV